MSSTTNRSNLRWVVCGLLFLATTINYMDRSALSLVEPILKHLLGGDQDLALYNRRYSDIVNSFIFAYGLGFLVAGRVVDRIGVKKGYALSIGAVGAGLDQPCLCADSAWLRDRSFCPGRWESRATSLLHSKRPPTGFPPKNARWPPGIFNSGTSVGALVAPLLIPWVAFSLWLAGSLLHHGQPWLAVACSVAVVSLRPAPSDVRQSERSASLSGHTGNLQVSSR